MTSFFPPLTGKELKSCFNDVILFTEGAESRTEHFTAAAEKTPGPVT